ncbi:hypothetical protein BJ944DRAFT_208401 [Cunninghamella echinulata]|nr:hypothetical protein BJ944DRAFT_208401 [Cunninghamella echinulata]
MVKIQKQIYEKEKEFATLCHEIGENLLKFSTFISKNTDYDFFKIKKSPKGSKSKKNSEKRDLPKKPSSPYMCFSKSERSRVNQENPGQTTQAIASLLGKEWRALSEKEKQPYVDLAKQDKERYERELRKLNDGINAVNSTTTVIVPDGSEDRPTKEGEQDEKSEECERDEQVKKNENNKEDDQVKNDKKINQIKQAKRGSQVQENKENEQDEEGEASTSKRRKIIESDKLKKLSSSSAPVMNNIPLSSPYVNTNELKNGKKNFKSKKRRNNKKKKNKPVTR